MFKTANLSKIVITGAKESQRKTTELLHERNIFHVKDFTEEKGGLTIGEALPEASELSRKFVRIKSLMSALDVEQMAPAGPLPIVKVEHWLENKLDSVETEVTEQVKEKTATESRLDELKREKDLMVQLDTLPQDLRLDIESVGVFVGILEVSPNEALGNVYRECTIHEVKEKKEWLVAIFVPPTLEQRVKELLEVANFRPLDLPEFSGTISGAKKAMDAETVKLETKLVTIEKGISDSRTKHGQYLLSAEEYLANDLDIAQLPLHCASTKEFFIIEGWVPSDKVEELSLAIPRATANSVTVEEVEAEDPETPVLMKNAKPAKPYESLVDAFSTPKAKEIDPTSLVAILFPIFFGFMLGDIGYGIVILCLVGSGITNKLFKFVSMEGAAHALNRILVYSAVASIIFGIIYGEFFGFLMFTSHEYTGFLFPDIHYGDYHIATILFGLELNLPLDRLAPEGIQLLIVLSAMIGIGHLYLAWFLGFRNVAIFHGVKHAILEKGGWLITLTGGWMLCIILVPVIMAGHAFELFSLWPMLSIILLVVGLLISVKGEGATAAVELPTMLLSNTLSYTRLFAIGASSAGIALAFNNMGVEQWNTGGVGMAMGALILFMGHFINVLLGLIGPTLHSLRLQYVEFFTKFYEGGGNRYKPFGKRRRHTSDN